MYVLNLERESCDDLDFEGSRHQFRLGPELLPSSKAKWSKPWHPVTGVAGSITHQVIIIRVFKLVFANTAPTRLD